MPNQREKDRFFHPDEYYRLLDRRDEIRNAMSASNGDYESNWENGILRQIEWTRQRLGFTNYEMMRLMDLNEPKDRRQGTTYRRLLNRIKSDEEKEQLPAREISGPLHLENFLMFCYVFGYDVESITELTLKSKKVDNVCMEVANTIYSFDADTLELIRNQILEKREHSSHKAKYDEELTAIDKVIAAKKAVNKPDKSCVKKFLNNVGNPENRAHDIDDEICESHITD